MNRLKDQVAIITGAAAGIGRACAELLAREGAAVVLTDIDESGGRKLAKQIEQDGGKALFLRHDVSSEDDWRAVVDRTREVFDHLDILVNNAGIYLIRELAETTVQDMERVLRINVQGVFLGMKHCAPAMEAQGGGSIVNLSSVAGICGFAGHTAYGASKGAVRTMTKDVAIEYARRRVRVNSVHPAYIRTEMAEMGAKSRGVSMDDLGEAFPTGEIGEPLDVAYGVLYLASEESKFVTGSELVIDGALTAQ